MDKVKKMWRQKVSLKMSQEQLARAQHNLATVVQAAQDQEDWVRCLTEQSSAVHPATLEENLTKLDQLCDLAHKYWLYCVNKSAQVDRLRQQCCLYERHRLGAEEDLDTNLDLSLNNSLDHSFDRSVEVEELTES